MNGGRAPVYAGARETPILRGPDARTPRCEVGRVDGGSAGDGPGSGARAEAMLPGRIGSIALVARKTPGGSDA
jgi:hypothetical protein